MYYQNEVGKRYPIPELPLEPPDCWRENNKEDDDETFIRVDLRGEE